MQSTDKPQHSADESQAHDVPDRILYLILFKHLVDLKKHAENASARGGRLDYLKLYEEQAELDSSESEILFAEAEKCMDAIKPIDDQARRIINQQRGTGEIKSPDELPSPRRTSKNFSCGKTRPSSHIATNYELC